MRASELADRFGTPLVAYCERTIRARAQEIRAAAPDAQVFYGSKAFPNVAVLRLLAEEGVGADVSTLGELAFARAAGLAGEQLVVHGNAKSDEELRAAAEAGATVVLDGYGESERAAGAGVRHVLVRVTLGVEADTHEAIQTGHHGSKFGLPPDDALRVDRGGARTRARRRRASRPRRLAARRPRRARGDHRACSRTSPRAAATSSAGLRRS